MKKQFLFALIFAVVTLSGCQRDADNHAASTTESAEPAAAAKDCPAADDSGHVDIAPGLSATILKTGYGRAAATGDQADVDAKLWVYDEAAEGGKGQFVWESGDQPFRFQLGQSGLIDGWTMGIECMLVGEHRELIIAADLAYGEKGRAPIPPNAAIIYDLKLQRLTAPQ